MDEYVAAFGKAAPDVRSYLDYFEQLTIGAAEGILAKATAAVTPNTPEATRVQFLVDSLAHFKMRRTLICRLFPTKHATCDDAGSAACPAKSCAATDTNCLYQAAEDAWNCEKQRMNGLYGPVVNGPAKSFEFRSGARRVGRLLFAPRLDRPSAA